MKEITKKLTCVAMAGVVIASVAGCSGIGGGKNKVLEAVGEYCDAIVDLDVSTIEDLSTDDLEDGDIDLEADLSLNDKNIYHGYASAFVSSVADTLTYEIDEGSLCIDKGNATVDVRFNMADHEALLADEELTDIDLMLDAMEDADTSDINVTLTLKKSDEGWKIEGSAEILSEVYDFTKTKDLFFFERIENLEIVRIRGIIGFSYEQAQYEMGGDWTLAHHTSDSYFGVSMVTQRSGDYDGFYAVAMYNGEVIAYEQDTISLILRPEELGTLENGEYNFMFFDPEGELYFGCTIISEV